MGSNVSRRSGKGLSGRRAQSSGSLYRLLAPRVGRVLNPCGEGKVRRRDRNKFSGSLPNRLDEKQVSSGGSSSAESLYHPGSNRRARAKAFGLLFRGQQDPGGGDQGYGSEWSPEEEMLLPTEYSTCSTVGRSGEIAFITKENTFEAKLEKGSRGLGLSVTGGIDTADLHPGLIRIKRIFPHQPAWECGTLQLGDIILEANGTPLTGLTNHEALEVLRTTPSKVFLKICRPPRDTFAFPAAAAAAAEEDPRLPRPPTPPPPPKRNVPLSSHSSNPASNLLLPLPLAEPCGEFDLILNKINGSLGFTLRKEDESVLGHYVRALVREPAISDGRIRPGDKIVSVNGVDISPMSHGEAVAFLRRTGDEVSLRLYRDPAQTPITALSPTESHKPFRLKPVLRKEAIDMLSTLAERKLGPNDSSRSGSRTRLRAASPGASPRRMKPAREPADREGRDSTEMERWKEPIRISGVPDEDDFRGGDEDEEDEDEERSEPASMPLIPTPESEFGHKNPVYQSDTRPGPSGKDRRAADEKTEMAADSVFQRGGGSQGLLKWKNVVFAAGDDEEEKEQEQEQGSDRGERVLTVELCRGWNSRLGFSLRNSDSKTLISAIYPDSVAAKDGRLRTGDELIMINEESTMGMTTSEVIDLLRKVRGPIAIKVVRSRCRRRLREEEEEGES